MEVEDDERSETLSQVSSNASTEPLSPQAHGRQPRAAAQESQVTSRPSTGDADTGSKGSKARGGSLTSDLSNLSDDDQPSGGAQPDPLPASGAFAFATGLQAPTGDTSARETEEQPGQVTTALVDSEVPAQSTSLQPTLNTSYESLDANKASPSLVTVAPAEASDASPPLAHSRAEAELDAEAQVIQLSAQRQAQQKRKRVKDEQSPELEAGQPSLNDDEASDAQALAGASNHKKARTEILDAPVITPSGSNGLLPPTLNVPSAQSPSRSTSPAGSQQETDANLAARPFQRSGSEGTDDGQEPEEDYDGMDPLAAPDAAQDLEVAPVEHSSADEAEGDRSDEGEEPDDADQNRTKAIESLFKIEIEFAKLRDALFLERMAEANHEKQLVQEETHPDMVMLNDYITSRRVTRLDIASKWLTRLNQEYDVERQAAERMVWSQWTEDRANLKADLLDEVNGKRRALEREKRVSDRGNRDERLIALQNEHNERLAYQSQISEATLERNMMFTEQDLAGAFRRQTIHREADYGMLGLPKEAIAYDLNEMSTQFVAPRAMPNWSLGPPHAMPGASAAPHTNGFGPYGPVPPQPQHQPPSTQSYSQSAHQPTSTAPVSGPSHHAQSTESAPTPSTQATIPDLPQGVGAASGSSSPVKTESGADVSMTSAPTEQLPQQSITSEPGPSQASPAPVASSSTPVLQPQQPSQQSITSTSQVPSPQPISALEPVSVPQSGLSQQQQPAPASSAPAVSPVPVPDVTPAESTAPSIAQS